MFNQVQEYLQESSEKNKHKFPGYFKLKHCFRAGDLEKQKCRSHYYNRFKWG